MFPQSGARGASRNARGLVEYESDFFILAPVEPERTAGVLVYDVANRGNKRILAQLDDAQGGPAEANDPKTLADAGLGFTLGRGYTLVWSGWDPGAPRANSGLSETSFRPPGAGEATSVIS